MNELYFEKFYYNHKQIGNKYLKDFSLSTLYDYVNYLQYKLQQIDIEIGNIVNDLNVSNIRKLRQIFRYNDYKKTLNKMVKGNYRYDRTKGLSFNRDTTYYITYKNYLKRLKKSELFMIDLSFNNSDCIIIDGCKVFSKELACFFYIKKITLNYLIMGECRHEKRTITTSKYLVEYKEYYQLGKQFFKDMLPLVKLDSKIFFYYLKYYLKNKYIPEFGLNGWQPVWDLPKTQINITLIGYYGYFYGILDGYKEYENEHFELVQKYIN